MSHWISKFLSGDQTEVDTGAVLWFASKVFAVAAFAFYAFYLKVDMGPNLADLAKWMLGSSVAGFGFSTVGAVIEHLKQETPK